MIAQHGQIEAALARHTSLAVTLHRLGLTYHDTAQRNIRSIRENGREVFRGTCSEVWAWLVEQC